MKAILMKVKEFMDILSMVKGRVNPIFYLFYSKKTFIYILRLSIADYVQLN